MNYSIILTIASIIYMTILIIVFFIKDRVKTEETNIFSTILVCTYAGLLLEFLSFILIQIGLDDKSILFVFVSKMILVYFFIWSSLFSMYINVSAKLNKLNTYYKYIVPLGSVALLLLPMDFIKSKGMIIPSGFASQAIYFVIMIYIVLALSKMILCKNKDIKKFVPLITFIISMTVSTIVQYYNPTVILGDLIFSCVVYIMSFTIENPDVKMVQALELAKEEAEKANRSKTEFLSSMSHEIRTPLNAIVGFSDCILDANTVTEAKENAKDIVNASQTLLEIVNGILDISKIEAGKLEIVNTKYNPKEVFTELAKLITPRMQDKGLDFTYEIDSSLPATLYGDKANIKKIVTNFLSNACKYTDHGFVRYEVHSVRLGEYVRLIISVEDSGRGIRKDSIDQLFTRFQRLDEDKNTTIEGTGLGLAITKQLTELMGGKVIVHTVYGEGSKFTAVINQRIEEMDAPQQTEVFESLDLHDVKILIVDDAPLNLKVATKLFEKYNANFVDTCSSGFDCIEKIMTGHKYDIIFLDDMMPKMSGIETFQKLKEIPTFKTPTVALTANAISGMREKYLAAGFDDYIAKPIEQNELIRVCNMLLGREEEEETSSKPVEKEEEKVDEEKNKIIPVEDNIESVLGDMVDLTKDKNAFTSMISKTEILKAIQEDSVELLDDEEEEISTTPEIISVEPVDLLPVVDLDIKETPQEENEVFDESYLKKNGADLDKAMELLGDMEMYNMTIHDFLDEIDDKWRRINDTLSQEDMKNYSIDVHSLKSDCKYLGFMGLADIAYQHELKSKDNDLAYCKEHFPELEEEYYRVIDVIRNYADHNPVEE